jgi:hypothetical protein
LEGSTRQKTADSFPPTEACTEIRSIGEKLLVVENWQRRKWEALARPPDEDAMFEGRIACDQATEKRTVVEGGEDLRRAVESLERVSQVTEDDLGREHPGQR